MLKFILSLIIFPSICFGQDFDLIYGNPTKDQLLKISLLDDNDSTMEVIRIDHIGTGKGLFIPLLFTLCPVSTSNEFEFIPVVVKDREMVRLMDFIRNNNSEIVSDSLHKFGTLRITFRAKGQPYQYYISNMGRTKKYLKRLEVVLRRFDNQDYVVRFRRFRYGIGI